jgi:hypothetical protein
MVLPISTLILQQYKRELGKANRKSMSKGNESL